MAKLYPFSMVKHGNDLELARDLLFNHYIYGDNVSDKMRLWAEDGRERLGNILLKSNGIVAWLTGEEWALASKAMSWAINYREAANSRVAGQ